jgi:hypothetical protein
MVLYTIETIVSKCKWTHLRSDINGFILRNDKLKEVTIIKPSISDCPNFFRNVKQKIKNNARSKKQIRLQYI